MPAAGKPCLTILRGCAGMIEYPLLGGRAVRRNSSRTRGRLARTTFLHLRKRRYRCECGKRFFEKNTFLGRYQRATKRAIAAAPSGPWYCPTMAVSTME